MGEVVATEVTVPDPPPHVVVASTMLPLESDFKQFPLTSAPDTLANSVVVPDLVPAATALLPAPIMGRLEVSDVPVTYARAGISAAIGV